MVYVRGFYLNWHHMVILVFKWTILHRMVRISAYHFLFPISYFLFSSFFPFFLFFTFRTKNTQRLSVLTIFPNVISAISATSCICTQISYYIRHVSHCQYLKNVPDVVVALEGEHRENIGPPRTKTGKTIDPKLSAVSDSPIVPASIGFISTMLWLMIIGCIGASGGNKRELVGISEKMPNKDGLDPLGYT